MKTRIITLSALLFIALVYLSSIGYGKYVCRNRVGHVETDISVLLEELIGKFSADGIEIAL